MDEPRDRVLQSVDAVRGPLLRAIEADQVIPPGYEARVHEAIDLLRAARADRRVLSRIEDISCTMWRMHRFLREGRVNAYDSARLRIRAAARSL